MFLIMITLQRITWLLCLACTPLYPQTAPVPAATETSCRQFVQQFYDWYLPKARTSKIRASDLVLKEKNSALSPELAKELKEDSEVQSNAPDSVGLDFDPFLNSQDDGFQKCAAAKAVIQGESCRVDISCNFPKQRPQKLATPELLFTRGQWVFVNFHYHFDSGDDDLLHVLKTLSEERTRISK